MNERQERDYHEREYGRYLANEAFHTGGASKLGDEVPLHPVPKIEPKPTPEPEPPTTEAHE